MSPLYLAAASAPGWSLALYWVWFGVGMHGLLNLMHECAHYHAFQRRWASDVLGGWLLGPLTLADFVTYRERHWNHHRNLGVAGDTKDAYLIDVRGWRLLHLLWRCLTLQEAASKFRSTRGSGETAARGPGAWLPRVVVVQAAFGASLVLAALLSGARDFASALLAYAIYAYGIASLTLFVASLRTIAEHQIGDDAAPVVGRAALRNFSCGPLGRLLLGAYGFAEHATHHTEPAIPSYRLPAATADLVAAGAASLAAHGTYFTVLAARVRARRLGAAP